MTEAFFDGVRDLFGGRFTRPQVDGATLLDQPPLELYRRFFGGHSK